MVKKYFIVMIFEIISLGLFSQSTTVELSFTAVDSEAYVQLDSIKIMNLIQGVDTVLYWPDTLLSLHYYQGLPENHDLSSKFKVFQNYPNPMIDRTIISLYAPKKDKIRILITDVLGRKIIQTEKVLKRGKHSFRFTPGIGKLYFFNAQCEGQSSSIKILSASNFSAGTATLEYLGNEPAFSQLKVTDDIINFSFIPGDQLLYIGYVDSLQSGMLDSPEESKAYTFQYATDIPCPSTPTVEYEGQVYNTVQIFSQCWLKENLNVGMMIDSVEGMLDNGIIEKYCYHNESDSCTKYGGLYQWDEMMQYTTLERVQGICPPGWHLPKDEEWKMLEGAVDSKYGIGDNTWDGHGRRGYDAGAKLKNNSGWHDNGNGTNLYGFSGLPGGYCDDWDGSFFSAVSTGLWWSSTENLNNAWVFALFYLYPESYRVNSYEKGHGLSVRCLRDY